MLASQVDVLSARSARAGQADRAGDQAPQPAAPVIPPDLAVVRMSPAARAVRAAPPVPTSVPIAEPDPERIEQIARRGEGREIVAEAGGELERARRKSGVDRAHALEAFAERYPRHPFADNALVEAASAYADAGRDGAACELARRATQDYPAGDAMSDALERLATCEAHRGDADAERRLLERLVADYPRTPAAERAGTRLAQPSGRSGTAAPAARSGP